MKESSFSKVLRDDIKAMWPKVHMYLIQDSFRSGKKPYDFFFTYKSRFYAIELKVVKGQSIPLDILRPHQVENLKEVEASGTHAYGLVCMEIGGFKSKFSVVLPIKLWLEMVDMELEDSEGSSKSMKIAKLISYCHVKPCNESSMMLMERKKIDGRTMWDVEKIRWATGCCL